VLLSFTILLFLSTTLISDKPDVLQPLYQDAFKNFPQAKVRKVLTSLSAGSLESVLVSWKNLKSNTRSYLRIKTPRDGNR